MGLITYTPCLSGHSIGPA